MVGVLLASQARRPVEDPLARRRPRLDRGQDARIDPLVEARNRAHDRRLDLDHVRRQPLDQRLGEDDCRAAPERDHLVDDPSVDVAQRQEGEEDIGLVEVDDLHGGFEVVEQVAVAEDRALRIGCRTRRMDHGRVVVAVDLLHRVLPGDAVGGVEVGAGHDVVEGQRPGRQLAARLDADDVLEGRAFGPDRLDLVRLLGVLDEDHLRADVVDDKGRLACLRLRVDRAGHRAEGQRGKVGDRPLGPGPGDDRDAVAIRDAEVS